ncbi:MAG: thiamine-phosphate kinase [Bacteroidaceae bacterium]|nr:thiamine-phosphate kinase [Bacteroidaceae bacterium]
MTPLSSLGEFGLIRRLTAGLEPQNASTLKGPGDDCAVLSYGGRQLLLTTDLLLEGVHFDLVYTPLKHLGYKAAAVNFSDIYACGGTPRQLTVSIAVDRRISVESLDEFYAGLRLACQRYGCDLVGGDTSSSLTGFAISVTCVGEAPEDGPVTRSGAKDTDLVCVSGNLGAAYLGLQLLEREKKVFAGAKPDDETAAQPDFSGHEYLLERFLKPEPRRDIVEALAKAGIRPTSMIDVCDGLSSELLHLCRESHVGCRIFEERIPLDYQTALCAEEFNLNVTTCALDGGEDYELLFTVPLAQHEAVAALDDVHVIGHITRPELGPVLVLRGGAEEVEIKAQGWVAEKATAPDGAPAAN